MKKDLELWELIAERLKLEQSVVLLVVTESSGSSPGRQGFKMAVAEDVLFGSIGGGVMEVELAEAAKWKIDNGKWKTGKGNQKTSIVSQVHRKDSPNSSGMICSGEQRVVLFELGREHKAIVRELISVVENAQAKKLQISDSELCIVDRERDDPYFGFELNDSGDFLYEELLGFKNKLSIIGGGHCALALSELMSKMDFHITLFDDRPELNTLNKNSFVHEKRVIDSYDAIGEYVSSEENHYVVVMTLGYKFDEIVIRKLFDKNFEYFGVLGSRVKMAALLKVLLDDGFDKDRLEKIRTPIGVEINSRTPEEIAVSIAAEIIAVKNAKG